METTITTIELSERLEDVLDRVKNRGERFKVERDGEKIAEIVPPSDKPSGDLRELVAKLALLSPLDDDSWSDIEEARASVLPFRVSDSSTSVL